MFFKGILCLLLTLGLFSLFSTKSPKGDKAMSGLANAAVATFLVEAIYKYIGGGFMEISFLSEVGSSSGSLGGVAAAILVPLSMGASPVLSVALGVSVLGFGILPGFIAGYLCYFLICFIEKKIPQGINIIFGALMVSLLGRTIVTFTALGVDKILGFIADSITCATNQSPLLMGFILGGLMKMICTSPLSSMALTAMLNLTGLPMGIAAIACFGGSFTNGMIFKNLKLGNQGNVLAVMLEPLTQADIITKHPIPIYSSNLLGGGTAGIVAAALGIVNNAPGTASPIPGMLAPFAFNNPKIVLLALLFAAICGTVSGLIGSFVYTKTPLGIKINSQVNMDTIA